MIWHGYNTLENVISSKCFFFPSQNKTRPAVDMFILVLQSEHASLFEEDAEVFVLEDNMQLSQDLAGRPTIRIQLQHNLAGN